MLRPPPISTLFPYTTLFRSHGLPGRVVLAGPGRGSRRRAGAGERSEEHTSELQSLRHLVCRLLLEKKKIPGLLIFREQTAEQIIETDHAESFDTFLYQLRIN